jgi:hypothetical protein
VAEAVVLQAAKAEATAPSVQAEAAGHVKSQLQQLS